MIAPILVIEERLKVCGVCEEKRQKLTTDVCGVCKCLLSLKTKFKNAKCPLNRWKE